MDTPNTVILPVICWAQLLDPLVGGSDFWQRDRLIILSNPMLQFQLPMASEIRAQWKSGISGSRGRPEATSGQKEPPGEREDVCSTLSENALTSLTVVRWKSWEKHLFFYWNIKNFTTVKICKYEHMKLKHNHGISWAHPAQRLLQNVVFLFSKQSNIISVNFYFLTWGFELTVTMLLCNIYGFQV